MEGRLVQCILFSVSFLVDMTGSVLMIACLFHQTNGMIKGKFSILAAFLLSLCAAWPKPDDQQGASVAETASGVKITCDSGTIDLELLGTNLLRVDIRPGGKSSRRTPVIDPSLKPSAFKGAIVQNDADQIVIRSATMVVSVAHSLPYAISIAQADGRKLLDQPDPFAQAHNRELTLRHAFGENLYGMSGLGRLDNGESLLRNNGSEVQAGSQGEGGAPFFFTTKYGVLIDSDGGTFFTSDGIVDFNGGSRADVEYFVIAGPPLDVMTGLATLTGRPPMPPKWTLGFLNSQWGSDETEIKQIAATYRRKRIPIDAFILDYDWKAWGEDGYGEWRWNSTAGPGNQDPDKFPDGASGHFAETLRAQGFKLAGILKPRILVNKSGSTNEMDEAAAYAETHGLWYPGEPPSKERPLVRNLDFANPETRSWYWKHLEPAFDAGIIAWWNDEADHCYPNWPVGSDIYNFNNFQFLNMGKMLYEGQRGYSDLRVWSLNRNYYLGAQRYSYAEWSGDIQTGFQSMQDQQARMLATLDLGEPHWSMDTGGFSGHPSPENYARWMEFAAFAPIDRVHGTLGEKRQPWVYGPVAEAAAVRALRLRYELLPYIYSYEHMTTETGVGIVRPLFWMFPEDPNVSNESSSWMFGDAFLVSPVVKSGEVEHSVYLPPGNWFDYFRGTAFKGGQKIRYQVDPDKWQDIPLFVRAGSIIATAPPQDYTDQHAVPEVTLDVFAENSSAHFTYYDDNGTNYDYEHGVYYRQSISVSKNLNSTHLVFDKPSGTYKTALKFYLIRIHGSAARNVLLNGDQLPRKSEAELIKTGQNSWASGQDRFGSLTILKIPASHESIVTTQQ
jgi:alpha-glucosidase